ncbi:putative hydrolases of HD superfamily [Lentibacillus halodurans]|uniref:5'-deoxynucleotidase n=1 Tax=Lentibacillus halodurans TaxID=237679 RepID=A0A1I0X0Z3_9BACI|nr:HD domain-containing protein [Lentibacillus halodurans]SFA94679.1 putative hydrolases of HD superfamily [Lentibacillus halodurans]
MEEYANIISFIQEIERLKDTERTAWTSERRRESTAEHSWRLAMFMMALEDYFQDINFNRVLKMALLHDLGEAYTGDVSAKVQVDHDNKLQTEKEAFIKITESLSESAQCRWMALWAEYNEGQTKEARMVKALDKIETIIQHNQGVNPSDFDYHFNLAYGKEHASFDPVIESIRELVDRDTRMNC